MIPKRIVGEISISWPASKAKLSAAFENVIEVNRERGFRLESWQFSQVPMIGGAFNETIIAVFVEEP